jgi:hypothetical protein
VGYGLFAINGRMLGHGDPVRVKQGERVLFHTARLECRAGEVAPDRNFARRGWRALSCGCRRECVPGDVVRLGSHAITGDLTQVPTQGGPSIASARATHQGSTRASIAAARVLRRHPGSPVSPFTPEDEPGVLADHQPTRTACVDGPFTCPAKADLPRRVQPSIA